MVGRQRVVVGAGLDRGGSEAALEITTEVSTAGGTAPVRRRPPGPPTTVQHAAVCVAQHHGLVQVGEARWVRPGEERPLAG